MTEQRQKVLDEKKHVSSKVSDLCRYIGFGVVAATWTIFTSTSDFAKLVVSGSRTLLMLSASLGMLTILFDYLQFLAGYLSVNAALKNPNSKYDETSRIYKTRILMFWAKQVSAVSATLALLWVVFSNI